MLRNLFIASVILTIGLAPQASQAGAVLLDFETPSTGSNLIAAPLTGTGVGDIFLENGTEINNIFAGGTGNALLNDTGISGGAARITTTIPLINISFVFGGDSVDDLGAGQFQLSVFRDLNDAINGVALNTFFEPDTFGQGQIGPIGLTGNGELFTVIEFSDPQLGRAVIDNLFLNPIPLPAALPLFLTALAALGIVSWRRRIQ